MSDVEQALNGLIDIREPMRNSVEQVAELLIAFGLGLVIALLIVGVMRVLAIRPVAHEMTYSQRIEVAAELPPDKRLVALAAVYREARAARCGEPMLEAEGLQEALYRPAASFDVERFEAALNGLVARERA